MSFLNIMGVFLLPWLKKDIAVKNQKRTMKMIADTKRTN